jgi:hypothetical protein
MKTTILTLLLLGCDLRMAAQEKKLYSYFVPETKTPDSATRIEVNQKGDTVLIASYRTLDAINKTNNEFTKVYKGTPFFKNGWYKGFILENNGRQSDFLMAYNLQKEVVYLVTDPLLEATVMKPPTFWLEGHTFKLIKGRYFEPIYEGKTMILKDYQCLLQPSRATQRTGYETEGGDNEYEGEFVKFVKYYLVIGDKWREVTTGKRFYKLFGNQAEIIETYVKLNALNPNKEKDLSMIFKYFEAL